MKNDLKQIRSKVMRGLPRRLRYAESRNTTGSPITLFILVGLFVGLQLPPVQTQFAKWATEYVTDKTGYDTKIEKVSIEWTDEAAFKGVIIKDKTGKEMISAEVLEIDFNFLSLWEDSKNIEPDGIKLQKARINLVTQDDKMNLLKFIESFGKSEETPSKPDTTSQPIRILIKEIQAEDVFFGYDLADEDSLSKGLFDYNHISLDKITGKIQNLKIAGDTIELEAKGLKAIEANIDFPIHHLTTFFRMTSQELRFAPLDFQFGYSALRDSIILQFDSMDDFADFNNKVKISANFQNSILTLDDLAIFSEELRPYRERIVIHSGKFDGKVSDFNFRGFDIDFGQKSRFRGDVEILGLPQIDTTQIVLELDNSKFWVGDIQKYAPPEVYTQAEKFGMIRIPEFAFSGDINAFNIAGQVDTQLGEISPDLRIHLDSQSYEGTFALKNFQLGVLTDMPDLIQNIDIEGEIKGKGFSVETASTQAYGIIPQLGFNGYNYQNLEINTGIYDQIIASNFSIADPFLKLNVYAEVDLTTEVAGLVVDLDTAFLDKIKLIDQPLFARTAFRASVHRFNLTNIDAELSADSTYFLSEHKDLEIKDIAFKIDHQENDRSITFDSDILSAKLYGQFNLERFVMDNLTLLKECLLYVDNDEEILTNYYKKKPVYSREQYDKNSYKADFEIILKNINPALHLFDPNFYLGRNTRFSGHFSRDFRTYATMTGVIDTLNYDDTKIYQSNMVFSVGKNENEEKANIDINIASTHQYFSDVIQTEAFSAEAHVLNQKIVFQTDINDSNSEDHINLNGEVHLLDSSGYRLDLRESLFFLVGQEWKNPDSTQITILGNQVNIKNLSFSNGKHLFDIEGNISENPEHTLKVSIQDLELGLFNNLLGMNIAGMLNGSATVKNVYKSPVVGSMIHLSDLHYDDFMIGDLSGLLTWNNRKQALHMNADLQRNGAHMVRVSGDISPTKEEDALNIAIQLLETDLEIAQPFTVGNISDFEGNMSGKINIKGTPSTPILDGKIKLNDARCRIDLLNTTYAFDDDEIIFREDAIVVNNFIVFDEESDLAEVSGGIYHDGFENFLIQIEGEMDRFQVLNTERSDEEIYYGTANMTGNFEVFGSLTDITISADVTTEKDTELYIPLDGYADVEETSGGFIKFVEAKENEEKDSLNNTNEESGDLRLQMKFNVNVTPDAYCAVIFDESAGDIMRGRGQGSISVGIDTKGDFKMLGEIEIVEGAYNFTFMNLINKEFKVGRGSSITWTGDPFSGVLNIKALYNQLALITPILSGIITEDQTDLLNHPSLRRKYEVEVGLLVTGELLAPDIGFSIDILDYPRTISTGNQSIPLGNYIQAFQSRLQSDDQELAKQVFSLIALQRFSAENAFSSMGSSAGGSVSELLSNQLSGWLSQVDDRLEIGLDLGGFDSEALKTFQLRFSYSLLGGRMRITRDGGFTNMENETDPASIIGNWTLEYLLTKNGQFKLKMYHKNSTATFNAGLRNNSTTGTSILMTKSFNSPMDLFRNQKKKEQKAKAKTNP